MRVKCEEQNLLTSNPDGENKTAANDTTISPINENDTSSKQYVEASTQTMDMSEGTGSPLPGSLDASKRQNSKGLLF